MLGCLGLLALILGLLFGLGVIGGLGHSSANLNRVTVNKNINTNGNHTNTNINTNTNTNTNTSSNRDHQIRYNPDYTIGDGLDKNTKKKYILYKTELEIISGQLEPYTIYEKYLKHLDLQ